MTVSTAFVYRSTAIEPSFAQAHQLDAGKAYPVGDKPRCFHWMDAGLGAQDGPRTNQDSIRTRDRMSLRKTVLIRSPKRSPPTNKLCQSTDYGFASDIRSRVAFIEWDEDSGPRPGQGPRTDQGPVRTRYARGTVCRFAKPS